MLFEWDEAKNRQNIHKHGISFEQAAKIFDGYTVDRTDDRFGYDEVRIFSLGVVGTMIIIAVIHTDRNDVCRIISARPAVRQERIYYEKEIRKAFNAR